MRMTIIHYWRFFKLKNLQLLCQLQNFFLKEQKGSENCKLCNYAFFDTKSKIDTMIIVINDNFLNSNDLFSVAELVNMLSFCKCIWLTKTKTIAETFSKILCENRLVQHGLVPTITTNYPLLESMSLCHYYFFD